MRCNIYKNTALITAVFLVISDRFLKAVAINLWASNPQSIFSWLQLTFIKNVNIAFSIPLLIEPLYIIIPIALVLLFLFLQAVKHKNSHHIIALSFILLGTFSNLYDRLMYGYIIDYIDLNYFTVFNVADILICLGVIFFIYLSYKPKTP